MENTNDELFNPLFFPGYTKYFFEFSSKCYL